MEMGQRFLLVFDKLGFPEEVLGSCTQFSLLCCENIPGVLGTIDFAAVSLKVLSNYEGAQWHSFKYRRLGSSIH